MVANVAASGYEIPARHAASYILSETTANCGFFKRRCISASWLSTFTIDLPNASDTGADASFCCFSSTLLVFLNRALFKVVGCILISLLGLTGILFIPCCVVIIKTQPVEVGGRRRKTEYMTPANIEKVIKLLRSAFKQAVRWEVIARNPFDFVTLPKVERKPREIWTAEIIRKALDSCKDAKLFVAMNLAFACSLRVGEILGLTWDNVNINDEDIAKDNASVYVDRELFRASKEVMDTLGNRDILFEFPPVMSCPKTRLILKTPKTATSVRRVWLPKTLAYILREWRDTQQKQKEFLGDEYFDYNLVVAHGNGRPCDCKIIEKSFNRLKEEAGLPNVVFHSLRHSSTTYKLKLNHGDIKATQGDTGHAQADMVTKVYAHILDEDRKVNAQKFESAFYANPDLRDVKPPAEQKTAIDLGVLIEQLKQSPELAQALAGLIVG